MLEGGGVGWFREIRRKKKRKKKGGGGLFVKSSMNECEPRKRRDLISKRVGGGAKYVRGVVSIYLIMYMT